MAKENKALGLVTSIIAIILIGALMGPSLFAQEKVPPDKPPADQPSRQEAPSSPADEDADKKDNTDPANPLPSQDDTSPAASPAKPGYERAADWMEEKGVSYGYSFVGDWSTNFRGGASTRGSAFRHLQDTSLSLSSDRALGWAGGTFFVNFHSYNGRDGSANVGDAQGYSNIEDVSRAHLFELWFEQVLFSDRVRFKVGKLDANSEFAFVENGAEFLNSSMGFSPTVFVFPTYPEPRMSFNVFTNPTEHLYVNFGFYDTADPGTMPITEVGGTWALSTQELAGRLGVGLWHNTGTFERFDGGTEKGTSGLYLVFDQTLWREDRGAGDSQQGVAAFFQYGYADANVSELKHHIGGGMYWTGALPGRDEDMLGVGASQVVFTSDPAAGFDYNSELALEFFYKLQITGWLNIGPDVQYIRNPGGTAAQDNALVGTVRVAITF